MTCPTGYGHEITGFKLCLGNNARIIVLAEMLRIQHIMIIDVRKAA